MRTTGGWLVLGDRRPGDPPLPDDLQEALREWAAYAETVSRSGRSQDRELLRRRGRLLASRVAEVWGRPVDLTDPETGEVEVVRVNATGPVPRVVPEDPGPTPWGTGLAVAAFFAVLVAMADVVLSRAFAEAFGLLWLPANFLIVLGLAPSLYLARRTPFWRWPALGAAVGLGVAWLVLLLDLLG